MNIPITTPLTPKTKGALTKAFEEAQQLRQSQINPVHLILGLLASGGGVAFEVLTGLGIPYAGAAPKLKQLATTCVQADDTESGTDFTPEATRVLMRADDERKALQHNYLGTEHLLIALVAMRTETLRKIGAELNLDEATVVGAVKEKLRI